jgi:hypothetical protein
LKKRGTKNGRPPGHKKPTRIARFSRILRTLELFGARVLAPKLFQSA